MCVCVCVFEEDDILDWISISCCFVLVLVVVFGFQGKKNRGRSV